MRRGTLVVAAALIALAACAGPEPSSSVPASVEDTPGSMPTDTAEPSNAEATAAADPELFAYDPAVPLGPVVEERRATTSSTVEHVTFAAADGERVPALLTMPRGARQPYACVVLGHGFRGDKQGLPVGDLLGRAGFASFAIDARFHGERLDPVALRRVETDPRLLSTLLRDTVVDLRRGIDYLETRAECDPERIGYIGVSMGGFLGSLLAGADPRVKAPVLLVSGASWPTLLDSSVAREFRRQATAADIERARAALDPVDPVHWVGSIAPRPVLMVNGDRDDAVPPASARALHAAANEPKTIVWYEGGHALPASGERERLLGVLARWLIEHLGD